MGADQRSVGGVGEDLGEEDEEWGVGGWGGNSADGEEGRQGLD